MKKFYATFGQSHVHPVTGEPMKDYWIEVIALTEFHAISRMYEQFGDQWSLIYDDFNFDMTFFPKGDYALRNEQDVDKLFEEKVKYEQARNNREVTGVGDIHR